MGLLYFILILGQMFSGPILAQQAIEAAEAHVAALKSSGNAIIKSTADAAVVGAVDAARKTHVKTTVTILSAMVALWRSLGPKENRSTLVSSVMVGTGSEFICQPLLRLLKQASEGRGCYASK